MDVFLTSAYTGSCALESMVALARRDAVGRHALATDPERAGLVLFLEDAHYEDDPLFRILRAHPLVRRWPEKVFMYNETDRPWCVLPGLYCSMPARTFDRRRQRPFPYVYPVNELVAALAGHRVEPDLLFSFIGAGRTAGVRQRLLALRHPRSVVEDSSAYSVWAPVAVDEHVRRKRRYAETIARSKFVLCPRGGGTSSYRLYEAMELGRAPVVLSDDWVAPDGPDWSAFLLRVPERDVERLPEILAGHEREHGARGAAARVAWERWFAPQRLFHAAVEACLDILASRAIPERVRQRVPSLRFCHEYLRVTVGRRARRMRRLARALIP